MLFRNMGLRIRSPRKIMPVKMPNLLLDTLRCSKNV